MPAGFFPLMKSGKGNWNYQSLPQASLGGRRMYFPRGKVLGGSSSINGLVVSRGNAGDYDRWAALGATGWSWREVLPYFQRIERYPEGDPALRGRDGPVAVNRVPLAGMNPTAKAFLNAGLQLGHPFRDDVNDGDPTGMAQMQGNYANGLRQSASRCYLDPVRNRPNLIVITGALVCRVLLEGTRAVGVELRIGRRVERLGATREVILSGGAINSPQLLQLSGIGDPRDLSPHGVTPLHALAGVGQNLKDHIAIAVKQRITEPHSLLGSLKPWAMARALGQYLLFRSGPTATGALEAWAHLKTDAAERYPDLQVYSVPILYNDHGRDIIPEEGCMAVMNGSRPKSTGTVRIASADPTVHPAIDPRYFSVADDLRVLRDGIRMMRELIRQPAYDAFRGTEYAPGAAATSDADLDAYIAAQANTLYHPVGTCRMGTDAASVVDPELRVHGLDGLRVIDASVMPDITSGNTHFPTMMLAERAADLILGKTTA
jgi:choline dehydrogenase